MTCIHTDDGLCPSCQEEYDEDPGSWLEFGQHAQGIANWKVFMEEMHAYHAAHHEPAAPDPSIPF